MWSIEAQEKPWNKTGGMTQWMASTASAYALLYDVSISHVVLTVHTFI